MYLAYLYSYHSIIVSVQGDTGAAVYNQNVATIILCLANPGSGTGWSHECGLINFTAVNLVERVTRHQCLACFLSTCMIGLDLTLVVPFHTVIVRVRAALWHGSNIAGVLCEFTSLVDDGIISFLS
jgi:hypothetical protein